MFKRKTILALVPARRGSKGIPDKNIKMLDGKPLIAYTIGAAKKSKYIDAVIVSTDSKKIAEISQKYGAEVPFIRPKELATDSAKSINVILHAMNWIENHTNKKYNYLILLQPTSPFRSSMDIDKAIEEIINKEKDALVSVCEVSENPYWMKVIDEEGNLKDFIEGEENYSRRQDLPKVYILNGAIYIAKWEVLKEDKSFYRRECRPFIMSKEKSLDIDNPLDFEFAVFLMKWIKRDEKSFLV